MDRLSWINLILQSCRRGGIVEIQSDLCDNSPVQAIVISVANKRTKAMHDGILKPLLLLIRHVNRFSGL